MMGRVVRALTVYLLAMSGCDGALDTPLFRVDLGGDLAGSHDAAPIDLAGADHAVPELADLLEPANDLYPPALDMETPCTPPLTLCDGICTDPSHSCSACSTPCALGAACVADGDCQSDACDAVTHICVADRCHDDRRDGNEADVDCGDGICPGCALGKSCTDDAQCASSGCDFYKHVCVFSCADHMMDNLETDVDCGGADACGGCGAGKKCVESFDCQLGHECLGGLCNFASCIDGHMDGTETAIDCGGSCVGCAIGESCKIDRDCASVLCDPGTLKCIATACSDHQKDGTETDVDCGGVCARCGGNRGCLIDSDCASEACDGVSYTCVGSGCSDHHVDGTETDVDCGGGSCGPCALYQRCAQNADCASNTCDASALLCVPPSCNDHVLDGNETGTDCGGECAACALAGACQVDQDCASTACDGVSFVCVADQCSDHRIDDSESDTDCGGLTCPGCAFGQMCNTDSDCMTGHTCSVGTPEVCM